MTLAQRLGFGPTPPANPPALTAAAQVLRLGRDRITPQAEQWQAEAWSFYKDAVRVSGEFKFGVKWRSHMLSRVRLLAATKDPTQDEPELLERGPAVDLLGEFAGGVDGQAQMIATLSVHYDVPGESWLTGETGPAGTEWVLRSSSEIREGKRRTGGAEAVPEVIDDASATSSRVRWRPLDPLERGDYYVAKLWVRDEEYRHLPSSSAKAALPSLRRLELISRYLDAILLSRLASAGVVTFPNEMTFPTRPEFAEEPDPFVSEWIETAREAIATPGTAAAVIPIPIKGPGEHLDKVRHITFDSPLAEKILDLRESEIRSLATTLDMPAEVLLGMGDLNHWSSWQLSEEAVKAHIAPSAELICHSLTVGWLRPMLEAAGVSPAEAARSVLWYDASELIQRPDRSEAAKEAFDRGELSPKAYRIHSGFDEADKPTDQEREQMALWRLLDGGVAGRAAEELGVLEPAPIPEPLQPGGPRPVADEDRPVSGPPDTRDQPPPAPGSDVPARAASGNGRKP